MAQRVHQKNRGYIEGGISRLARRRDNESIDQYESDDYRRDHYRGPVGFALDLQESFIGWRLEHIVEDYIGAKIGRVRSLRRRNESKNSVAYYAAEFRCQTHEDMNLLLRYNEIRYTAGKRNYKFRFGEASEIVYAKAVYKGPAARAPTDDVLKTKILKDIPYTRYTPFRWKAAATTGDRMISASMIFENFYEFVEAARSCTRFTDMKLYNDFKVVYSVGNPLPPKFLQSRKCKPFTGQESDLTCGEESFDSTRYRTPSPKRNRRSMVEKEYNGRSRRASLRDNYYSDSEREYEDDVSDSPRYCNPGDSRRLSVEQEDECLSSSFSSLNRSSDHERERLSPDVGRYVDDTGVLARKYDDSIGRRRKRRFANGDTDDDWVLAKEELADTSYHASGVKPHRTDTVKMRDLSQRHVKRARFVKQKPLASNYENEKLRAPSASNQYPFTQETEEMYDGVNYEYWLLQSPEQQQQLRRVKVKMETKQEPEALYHWKERTRK